MDYEHYEAEVDRLEKINKKHISAFKKWLKAKGLSDKTITKHAGNIDLYLNYYLSYYNPQEVKAGCYSIDGYLGSFFIRKALFSSCAQIKSNAASIKKFYACMLEQGVVEKDDYASLCEDIKDGMDEWLDNMRRYDEGLDDDMLYDFLG